MPVAEWNQYSWDLDFDVSGFRLTSLICRKSSGTGGGGRSILYDATPLSAEEDAKLVERQLFEVLSRDMLLPSEMEPLIRARPGLKSLVREKALTRIEKMKIDTNRVADACLEIVTNTQRSDADNQKALRWAEALRGAEPDSLRTRSLLGAAQIRCGLLPQSLITLADLPGATATSIPDGASRYEKLRIAFRILAKLKSDPDIQEISSLEEEFLLKRPSQNTDRAILQVVREAFAILPKTIEKSIANRSMSSDETLAANFRMMDRDGNGKITETEIPFNGASALSDFDKNHDGMITLDEFGLFNKVSRLSLSVGPLQLDAKARLANLNEAIQVAPESRSALNARALFLATSPDDSVRNGIQAIADATKACEISEWKNAVFVNTLAAAYAEAGKFDEAVKQQERALALAVDSSRPPIQSHLDLYKQRKPYRESPNASSNNTGAATAIKTYSAPLITPDQAIRSRRIVGSGSAWSPDSKKLVRNKDILKSEGSELEIIDLATNQTTTLGVVGVKPAWSPKSGGPIAFTKTPAGLSADVASQELWLVDVDGTNLRKVQQGGSSSWTMDGRLCFRTVAEDKCLWFTEYMFEKADRAPLRLALGILHPTVSHDGEKVVGVMEGRLIVRQLAAGKDSVSMPLQPGETGDADWSPDGSYVVYGSADALRFPGIWLIEVATAKKRLLSDIAATRPRWSPDGRFISVDDQRKNEIVLLDMSGLDLNKAMADVSPTVTAAPAASKSE